MRINFDIKVQIDNKQWNRMSQRLTRGVPKAVRVGWWSSRHPSGVPTAQVAAWNEEGHMNGGMFSGTITPPRPFIRTGFIPKSKKTLPKYYKYIHRIAMGTYTWGALHRMMAEDYKKLLQETILSWDSPANSAATVAIKGFNDPLIHTGNMYDSVKSRLVAWGSK